jgi:hypothetical protein
VVVTGVDAVKASFAASDAGKEDFTLRLFA